LVLSLQYRRGAQLYPRRQGFRSHQTLQYYRLHQVTLENLKDQMDLLVQPHPHRLVLLVFQPRLFFR